MYSFMHRTDFIFHCEKDTNLSSFCCQGEFAFRIMSNWLAGWTGHCWSKVSKQNDSVAPKNMRIDCECVAVCFNLFGTRLEVSLNCSRTIHRDCADTNQSWLSVRAPFQPSYRTHRLLCRLWPGGDGNIEERLLRSKKFLGRENSTVNRIP